MDKTIDIATDSSYTICKVSLDSSLKEELSSTILSNLNTLYQASIQNKSYSEISDNFKNDLSSLYNQLRRSLAYKKINSIEFTDVDITTSTFNDDGMLELEVFADYKMSYNDEDTEDYVSYTVLLDYNDDSFVLSDFSYSHQEKSDVSYE
jgi:glutaredoxin-related protein